MNQRAFAETFARIRSQVQAVIVGQEALVEGMLVALVSRGHVLVEGVPGLAKTLAARCLAAALGAQCKRIQFTPDLMPSDITGTSIYHRESGQFHFIPGPIFAELVLADEINRAPAKTQSALLEAMQEHRVTVDGQSRALPTPFFVMATQNPIESQGTYPLPEAELDRFLFKLNVLPPSRDVEIEVVTHHASGFDPANLSSVAAVATPDDVRAMQAFAQGVHVDPAIVGYAVDLVRATREDRNIQVGASPRASIALVRSAQVVAASQERNFVTPDDVKPLAASVLRHRLLLHPDAELAGTTPDELIHGITVRTPVPRLVSGA